MKRAMINIGRMLKGMMLRHGPMMITCREFETFIMDYLDGALSPGQRRVFELHMRLCRECREYLAAYQATIEVGKSVLGSSDEPVPDDVPEDLIKAVVDARKR